MIFGDSLAVNAFLKRGLFRRIHVRVQLFPDDLISFFLGLDGDGSLCFHRGTSATFFAVVGDSGGKDPFYGLVYS